MINLLIYLKVVYVDYLCMCRRLFVYVNSCVCLYVWLNVVYCIDYWGFEFDNIFVGCFMKYFMGFLMGKKKRVIFVDLLGFLLVNVVEIFLRNSLIDICFL